MPVSGTVSAGAQANGDASSPTGTGIGGLASQVDTRDGITAAKGVNAMADVGACTPQIRARSITVKKRAKDEEGDVMDWIDGHTTLVCNLFAEQVRKGNRPNTHLNNVGFTEVADMFFQMTGIMLSKTQLKNKWDKLRRDLITWRILMRKQTGIGFNWNTGTINMDPEWWKKITKEIPRVDKFKKRPLQNEDDLKVMFGNVLNEEQDHWNPMSSNPITPLDDDTPINDIEVEHPKDPIDNNFVDNGDDVEEVTPITDDGKRKARVILDKPNKKTKSSTALVIQEHISKLSETASSFVATRQGGISIDQVMEHVLACGAGYNSDEHFVATELFVKKDQREMFMTIPPNQRLNWLRRKYNVMYEK